MGDLKKIEKIKANLKWEKHPRRGELGFLKILFEHNKIQAQEKQILRDRVREIKLRFYSSSTLPYLCPLSSSS